MSREYKEEWSIELTVDHADRTYSVRRIDHTKSFPYKPVFSVQVEADDEIGAFNAARRVLSNLGFRPDHS